MNFLEKYNLPDPVCKYKWGWSTIRLLEGTTNSCHRVKSDSITPESLASDHFPRIFRAEAVSLCDCADEVPKN